MRVGKDSRPGKETLGLNDPKIKDQDKGSNSQPPNPMDEGFVYYED